MTPLRLLCMFFARKGAGSLDKIPIPLQKCTFASSLHFFAQARLSLGKVSTLIACITVPEDETSLA